ncbi:cytochrome complex iron-sulfur subunit [Deinococcus irradiatisoli]|uniref:Cytochrome complex iron-sulfur subunit n=1 Tax=Deinococcus irradiatisoli TaxID=2202254 RepID=A0A2Z3JB23_9DEIO|nr:Rieske 2Fe-2S domain-containing protein [Deinococcus irradiatisoli]AWN22337.1 cytochrome complex iron-sulfur subunit [Deinococcus irradiatisoli]
MTKYRRADPEISRRKFINVALGTAGAVGGLGLVTALAGVRPPNRITFSKLPAVGGDTLVHAEGDQSGQPIKVADLSDKITRAWPQGKDKNGNVVIKKDEPNNLLIVYKFAPDQLVAPTNLQATQQGVVAYSGICQHLGCQVGDNASKPETILCPCHSGAYDPRAGCKVIGGPPPKPLPQLPIKLDGEGVTATGPLEAPYFGLTESDWKALLEEAKTL